MTAQYKITFPEQNITVSARAGANLLDVIQTAGIYIEASCGGIGRCGKCKVFANGAELLACETIVTKDLNVFIPTASAEQGYEILAGSDSEQSVAATHCAHKYAIAVDIGTTTIVVKLIDLTLSRTAGTSAAVNAQRPFGADVITRINESMDDASKLSAIITKQMDDMIAALISDTGIMQKQVAHIVIAGNTTMSYILLGLPCRSLGLAPFSPAYNIEPEYSYGQVFHADTLSCPVYIMPYISAFVGGDIASGLLTLEAEDDFMLIDMGTNGELVYKKDGVFRCTSTAAGPAFEGAGISCGMGSTEGAISEAALSDGHFTVKTIGGKEPVGICGSGLLDIMAYLVRENMIDETGKITEDASPVSNEDILIATNHDTGQEIYLTQKDIREFQLAKSAIRTGLEILISESDNEMPDRVYLAGGFGQHLNPESALASGLLPAAMQGRITPAGNSSLAGAVITCIGPENLAVTADMANNAIEINLATHPRFSDLFMDNMMFE
jgi:uncharacterized 2Fe-2S/4Fe-4S cluster protein (DUF4445 family)